MRKTLVGRMSRTDWLSIVNICDLLLCNLSTVSESLFSYRLLTD